MFVLKQLRLCTTTLNIGLGAGAVTDEQPLETAELFRERAKELRTIADGTGDRFARKALLEVADNYERRAGQQERV